MSSEPSVMSVIILNLRLVFPFVVTIETTKINNVFSRFLALRFGYGYLQKAHFTRYQIAQFRWLDRIHVTTPLVESA